MKICIVGAGAIGGYLGAKLALAGEDVTLIARGPHLAAIRQHGLTLVAPDGTEAVAVGIDERAQVATNRAALTRRAVSVDHFDPVAAAVRDERVVARDEGADRLVDGEPVQVDAGLPLPHRRIVA